VHYVLGIDASGYKAEVLSNHTFDPVANSLVQGPGIAVMRSAEEAASSMSASPWVLLLPV